MKLKTLLMMGILSMLGLGSCNAKENPKGFPVEYDLQLVEIPHCPILVTDVKLYNKSGNMFYSYLEEEEDESPHPLTQIPCKVIITWLSYPEKQFYETTAEIDGDKIAEFFKSGAGYIESDKSDMKVGGRSFNLYRFDKLRLVFSVGGNVCVKLKSMNTVIEVAQAKSQRIATPASYWEYETEEPSVSIGRYYKEHEQDAEYLRKYGIEGLESFFVPERFDYNIAVKLANEADKLKGIDIYYYNDDLLSYRKEELIHLNDCIERGVIQSCAFDWDDCCAKEDYGIEIIFERNNISQFFKEHLKNGFNTLLIQLNKETKTVTVALTDGKKQIIIPEDKIIYWGGHTDYYSPNQEKDNDMYGIF